MSEKETKEDAALRQIERIRASEKDYALAQIEQIEALVHEGHRVAVDPHLAERMGAFQETAISLEDALEARADAPETREDAPETTETPTEEKEE